MFASRAIKQALLFLALMHTASAVAWAADEDTQRTISAEVTEVSLLVSEQTVLPAEGVRSYSEGTPGVVDVRLTRAGDQFILVGQHEGVTSLLFIMMDGSRKHFRIHVNDPGLSQRTEESERVTQKDNIRLDFYFVQLNRSNNHRIGLGYPQSLTMGNAAASFDFISQRFSSATAVVQEQALLRLDMAEASGWAKLRRKAAVITENGKRAEFYGGGEVNIPVQGSLTTGIHTINFGSKIEVLPRYDSETGRLQIELSAEVSDLTDDQGAGAPGRVRSTLKTMVNLQLGQAIVLAGLSSESKLKSTNGLPGLSRVPIVGFLFGSKRMVYQAVDNVVFIVPSVMDAASKRDRKRIETALGLYQNFAGAPDEQKRLRGTWEKP